MTYHIVLEVYKENSDLLSCLISIVTLQSRCFHHSLVTSERVYPFKACARYFTWLFCLIFTRTIRNRYYHSRSREVK